MTRLVPLLLVMLAMATGFADSHSACFVVDTRYRSAESVPSSLAGEFLSATRWIASAAYVLDTHYAASATIPDGYVSTSLGDTEATISSPFNLDTGYPSRPIVYSPIGSLRWWSCSFECDTGAQFMDSDGDGLPDWWEARYSPDGRISSMKSFEDADGDGMSNYEEFIALTDPTDPESRFIVRIDMIDGSPSISWIPDGNEGGLKDKRIYKVWGCNRLEDHEWSTSANDLHRFFKVTVDLPMRR